MWDHLYCQCMSMTLETYLEKLPARKADLCCERNPQNFLSEVKRPTTRHV